MAKAETKTDMPTFFKAPGKKQSLSVFISRDTLANNTPIWIGDATKMRKAELEKLKASQPFVALHYSLADGE